MKNNLENSINAISDSHITLTDLLESMSEVVGNEIAKRTLATKLLARFTHGTKASGSILCVSPGACGCGTMLTAMANRLGIVHTEPSVSRVLAAGLNGVKWEMLLQDIADSAWEEDGNEAVGVVQLRDLGSLLMTATGHSSSLLQSGLADLMRGRKIIMTSPEYGMRRLDTRRVIFVVMANVEVMRGGNSIGFHASLPVRNSSPLEALSGAGFFTPDLLNVFGHPVIEFQRLSAEQLVEVATQMVNRTAIDCERHHAGIRFSKPALELVAEIGINAGGPKAMEFWISSACETILSMAHCGRRIEAVIPPDIFDGGSPEVTLHERVPLNKIVKEAQPPPENIVHRPARSRHHPGPRMAQIQDLEGLLKPDHRRTSHIHQGIPS